MSDYCLKCMSLLAGHSVCPHCGYSGGGRQPHHLIPGTILHDNYLVGLALGQGGFGITYIGLDLNLRLKVAIKEYYPNGYANRNSAVSSEVSISRGTHEKRIIEGKERFLEEARTLARFQNNQAVVNVRHFFEENNTAYIVMDYLEGEDLRMRLKSSLFEADEIFSLMNPIFDALEEIHKEGLIHRDISPDNIMILQDGSLRLMDFGAARFVDYYDGKSVSVVLKSGYAPEEQYRSKGELGPWTDIYALCGTIYKCITGKRPENAIDRLVIDEMKFPSDLGFKISHEQEEVLKRGLQVDYKLRLQNMAELKSVLVKDKRKKGLKFNSLKKWFIIMICMPAFCSMFFYMVHTFIDKEGKNNSFYSVTLVPDDGMTVHDFEEAKDIIQGRAEAFSGDEYCQAEEKDGNIQMTMSKKLFQDLEPEKVLESVISRPMRFYLCENQPWSIDGTGDVVNVGQNDIVDAELVEGRIEGFDYDMLNMKDNYYLKLRLSKDFIHANENLLNNENDFLYLVQDIIPFDGEGFDTHYYSVAIPGNEQDTYYIVDDITKNMWEAFVYDLKNEPLEHGFKAYIDLNSRPVWEDVDSLDSKGINQTNVDDITNESITACWTVDSGFSSNELSDGERLDMLYSIRKRLDVFGVPYAIGFEQKAGRYDKGSLYVKIDKESVGYSIFDLIGCVENAHGLPGNLSIRDSLGKKYDFYGDVEVKKNNKDECSLVIKESEQSSNIKAISEEIVKSKNNMLYVMAGNMPLCAVSIDKVVEGHQIMFDYPMYANVGSFSGNNSLPLELLSVVQETHLPDALYFQDCQYNEREGSAFRKLNAEKEFGFRDKVCSEKEHQIKAKYSGIDMYSDEDGLKIVLNQERTGHFVDDCLALIKEIYSMCEIDENSIGSLDFYLTDKITGRDRGVLSFDKRFDYTTNTGEIVFDAYIGNGKLEEYKDLFKIRLNQDSFFVEKKDEKNTMWPWDE